MTSKTILSELASPKGNQNKAEFCLLWIIKISVPFIPFLNQVSQIKSVSLLSNQGIEFPFIPSSNGILSSESNYVIHKHKYPFSESFQKQE